MTDLPGFDTEPQRTPSFVTVDPASSGRVTIHMSIATADECREAALWLLELTDRFAKLMP